LLEKDVHLVSGQGVVFKRLFFPHLHWHPGILFP